MNAQTFHNFKAREIFVALGSQQKIADLYGVSQRTVSLIKRRERWAHATMEA